MIVAVIAAPDDKQKRLKVIDWIQSDYIRYKHICNEMNARGYSISLIEAKDSGDINHSNESKLH